MKQTPRWNLLLLTAPLLLTLAGCEAPEESASPAATETLSAELVLTNGAIYTVAGREAWVEAVAIKDGKYVFAGSSDEALEFIGQGTETIDLGGKMAMPGINDAHVHSIEGAAKELFECNFPFSATPDEIAAQVSECVAQQPDATWIKGGQWGSDFFVEHELESPREFLDAVSADKAVALSDDALHNVWFNSKALALVGIDRNTPNPPGVEILRDAEGEPTGVVLEVFGFAPSAPRTHPPPFCASLHLLLNRRSIRQDHQFPHGPLSIPRYGQPRRRVPNIPWTAAPGPGA